MYASILAAALLVQGQRRHKITSIVSDAATQKHIICCLLPKVQLIASTRVAQLLLRRIRIHIWMRLFILIKLTYLFLIVLLETYFLGKHLARLAVVRCIIVARCRLLANGSLYLLVAALTTDFSKALLLHHLYRLIQLIWRHLLSLVIIAFILLLQVNYLILPYIVLLLLIRQHLIEQLLNLLTVLTLPSIVLLRAHVQPASSTSPISAIGPLIPVRVITARVHSSTASSMLEVGVSAAASRCGGVGHQDVVAALVALVRLAQLVDLLQGFGLLVFLSVQA